MKRCYTPEMQEFIAANVKGSTNEELTAAVNEKFGTAFRTGQIKAYKANHHLRSGIPPGGYDRKPRIYPPEVYNYIIQHYKGTPYAEMARQIKERFGLEYTPGQMKAFYCNRGLNSGLTGRFESGHVPFNKGKKGWSAPGAEKTQFKKGHLPHNTKPLGYERLGADGYVQVKIKMRPSSPMCNDNFVQKHRLIYEQHYGPVPDGYVVIFKDGNRFNFAPENLAAISMAERLDMAQHGLFNQNPDITEAGVAVARVRTTANKLKRKLRRKQ